MIRLYNLYKNLQKQRVGMEENKKVTYSTSTQQLESLPPSNHNLVTLTLQPQSSPRKQQINIEDALKKRIQKSTIYNRSKQYITKSQHQANQNIYKKVLIIYASGSIGANLNMEIYKGYLKQCMLNNLYLCDYSKTIQKYQTNNQPNQELKTLYSPIQVNGTTIIYQIIQFQQIKSSIYTDIDHLKKIATKIKENYCQYDSFIVLCGFDVICYAATAVSFMLENLQKLVIFTGGYLPLSQMRNDSSNHLVQSFSIIAQSNNLNDVIIISKNKGYRANRATKAKQGDLDSIQSPNMDPLVEINIRITQHQHLYLCRPKGQFNIFTSFSDSVKVLKYHPYMNLDSLKYQLSNPHTLGIIIESYGSANLPMNEQVLQMFKRAYQNDGKIFINISQSKHSTNHSMMAPYLSNYGIFYGGDMTVQAAINKLAYLLGKGYNSKQIQKQIKISLRGQITQIKNQQQFQLQIPGFLQIVDDVLENYFPTQSQEHFSNQLINYLCRFINKNYNIIQFQNIFKKTKIQSNNKNKDNNNNNQLLKNIVDSNNLLHIIVKAKNIDLLKYFISLNININKQDQHQCSACYYALQKIQKSTIRILLNHGGRVICPINILMQLFIKNLLQDNYQFYELLYHMEFKNTLQTILNEEGRNIGHLAILLQAHKCLQILKNRFKFTFYGKDIYGMSGIQYVSRCKSKDIIKLFK